MRNFANKEERHKGASNAKRSIEDFEFQLGDRSKKEK